MSISQNNGLHFETNKGRMIYHILQTTNSLIDDEGDTIGGGGTHSRKCETFLPGRSKYIFDVNDDINASNSINTIPTVLLKSKEDCPPPRDEMIGFVSDEILDMVKETLSRLVHVC